MPDNGIVEWIKAHPELFTQEQVRPTPAPYNFLQGYDPANLARTQDLEKLREREVQAQRVQRYVDKYNALASKHPELFPEMQEAVVENFIDSGNKHPIKNGNPEFLGDNWPRQIESYENPETGETRWRPVPGNTDKGWDRPDLAHLYEGKRNGGTLANPLHNPEDDFDRNYNVDANGDPIDIKEEYFPGYIPPSDTGPDTGNGEYMDLDVKRPPPGYAGELYRHLANAGKAQAWDNSNWRNNTSNPASPYGAPQGVDADQWGKLSPDKQKLVWATRGKVFAHDGDIFTPPPEVSSSAASPPASIPASATYEDRGPPPNVMDNAETLKAWNDSGYPEEPPPHSPEPHPPESKGTEGDIHLAQKAIDWIKAHPGEAAFDLSPAGPAYGPLRAGLALAGEAVSAEHNRTNHAVDADKPQPPTTEKPKPTDADITTAPMPSHGEEGKPGETPPKPLLHMPSGTVGGTTAAGDVPKVNPKRQEAYQQALESEEKAVADIGVGNANVADVTGAGQENAAQKWIADADQAIANQKARQAHLDQIADDIEADSQALAAGHIDPDRRNTFQKILGVIAMGLGGFVQGYRGGNNAAADIIEKQIEGDVAAQRAELENKWNAVKTKHTLLGDKTARYGSMDVAEKQQVMSNMQAALLMAEGAAKRASSPIEKDRANQLVAQLQQRQVALGIEMNQYVRAGYGGTNLAAEYQKYTKEKAAAGLPAMTPDEWYTFRQLGGEGSREEQLKEAETQAGILERRAHAIHELEDRNKQGIPVPAFTVPQSTAYDPTRFFQGTEGFNKVEGQERYNAALKTAIIDKLGRGAERSPAVINSFLKAYAVQPGDTQATINRNASAAQQDFPTLTTRDENYSLLHPATPAK